MKEILIADDSPAIRRMLMLILERRGFVVQTASDGREALARLRAAPVDLLITDVNMPEIDGFELIRRLRADRQYDQMPIVALTGLEEDEEGHEIVDIGADALLKKPVSSWNLLQVLNQFA